MTTLEEFIIDAEARVKSTEPHVVLAIDVAAPNSEACAKFIELAEPFHPARINSSDAQLAKRAASVYRAFKLALDDFTREPLSSRVPTIRVLR